MLNGSIVLIGCGAIGTPIAHKLYLTYHDKFALLASGAIKEKLINDNMVVNNEVFSPRVISTADEIGKVSLLIVCVKNYDLKSALSDIQAVTDNDTIILPLQNGISSFEFFCENFPENVILQGYVQGPNTMRNGDDIFYSNAGVMHIGNAGNTDNDESLMSVYEHLKKAGVEVYVESDIKKMVWKKWMLNVAGNSVTALTGADYSDFKDTVELQQICREIMKEFMFIAKLENVDLLEKDIDDIIDYYVNYRGNKHTSMLEDVINKRRTENDFLAGEICRLAQKHNVQTPLIKSLHSLIAIKEKLYLKF